jgi:hypothetical protein
MCDFARAVGRITMSYLLRPGSIDKAFVDWAAAAAA